MSEYTITLPFPPSTNGYWRSIVRGSGRSAHAVQILSEPARRFRSQAQLAVRVAKKSPVSLHGRLAVLVTLNPPDRRRRDVDNHSKAILDALTHAGVWVDDEQVDDLRIVRGEVTPKGEPGNAVVTIRELAS